MSLMRCYYDDSQSMTSLYFEGGDLHGRAQAMEGNHAPINEIGYTCHVYYKQNCFLFQVNLHLGGTQLAIEVHEGCIPLTMG